jgi:tRNA A-37 threonylcarbamoyl transferase component Bud32
VGEPSELSRLGTFRQGTNEVFLLRHGGRELLAKCYRGEHPQARCDYERTTLQLWATLSLPVPRVWDIDVPELRGAPYLITDYLGRLTLQEWLQDQAVPEAAKLSFLARIFTENHRRHRLAVERNEPRLIHADPNSSNILRAQEKFYFIDFERPAAFADLAEAAAVELGKFCRWTVRDFGVAQLEPVMQLLVEAYAGDKHLLRLFIERTCARPFQALHRWRDRRRKINHPGDVTKYDLADALLRLL